MPKKRACSEKQKSGAVFGQRWNRATPKPSTPTLLGAVLEKRGQKFFKLTKSIYQKRRDKSCIVAQPCMLDLLHDFSPLALERVSRAPGPFAQ
jgi:hypothetical protein